MATHDRKQCTHSFDLSRSLSLDRLLQAEELSFDIWRDLFVRELHETPHPLIHGLAHQAWSASIAIARQRRSVEREAFR